MGIAFLFTICLSNINQEIMYKIVHYFLIYIINLAILILMRLPEQISDTGEHCTDITITEVNSYLTRIFNDIKNNKCAISMENVKNRAFLENTEYIISDEKIKNIILSLTYKNFCWYQKGEKVGDLLFIFRYDGKFLKLAKGSPFEDILVLYIKTNKKSNRTLVISIHPSDKPDELVTLFKE